MDGNGLNRFTIVCALLASTTSILLGYEAEAEKREIKCRYWGDEWGGDADKGKPKDNACGRGSTSGSPERVLSNRIPGFRQNI
ncbi:hypothetical protein CR513_58391, partial [Mucuna pruriens]